LKHRNPYILFLNLNAFSQTGGVEKVSRVLAKAGYELGLEENSRFLNLSLYDSETDIAYCPQTNYKGFSGNKLAFIAAAVSEGKKARVMLLSHVNLALPALVAKILNPSLKIVLIAHGIEIWRELSSVKKALLSRCDRILTVSNYTRERITKRFPALESRTEVLNNCLDPFFKAPVLSGKSEKLKKRYGITDNEKVILTLCRLSSSEQYKGYDQVIEALAKIKELIAFKYLLMGKYDELEYARIDALIKKHALEGRVILTGFVADEEITEHFLCGDAFIMPSTDEGFGIVFIEAGACGLPLIAGNTDGSRDALLNGELGELVNPADVKDIQEKLTNILKDTHNPKKQQQKTIANFNYNTYKANLKEWIL